MLAQYSADQSVAVLLPTQFDTLIVHNILEYSKKQFALQTKHSYLAAYLDHKVNDLFNRGYVSRITFISVYKWKQLIEDQFFGRFHHIDISFLNLDREASMDLMASVVESGFCGSMLFNTAGKDTLPCTKQSGQQDTSPLIFIGEIFNLRISHSMACEEDAYDVYLIRTSNNEALLVNADTNSVYGHHKFHIQHRQGESGVSETELKIRMDGYGAGQHHITRKS